jgi:hypothetical protein
VAKYPSTGGGDFQRPSTGMHQAVCTMIADVGYQPAGIYGIKPKVVFQFELTDENVEGTTNPLIVYDTLTASMSQKANLRAMLTGWRGKAFSDEEASDFEMKNVLGAHCQLLLVENASGEKVYTNIETVVPWPKGVEKPTPKNPLLFYDADNRSQLTRLPEWVQKKIQGAAQPPSAPSRAAVEEQMAETAGGAFEDDIPFAPLHKRALWA